MADILLAGGNVWDADAQTFVTGLHVLCREGAIAEVGRGFAAPDGAEVIDCHGRFLLPGLIDCHVHLASDGDPGWAAAVAMEPGPSQAWRIAENARKTVLAGFTTVRDLGAPGQLNVHVARAIDAGRLIGPQVVAAGMGVTMTGGHGHGFLAREADGPDDVRKAVREQLRAGATAIKLFASGGVMTPGVDPRSPSFTEAEMTAGVEEAHKAFRTVAAHAQAADGVKNAIRAGVDSIEHGVWLDEESLGLMVERGTYLVPTLTAPHHIAQGGLEAGIPKHMVEKAWEVLEDHLASYRAALGAGVRVAAGTDQGTPLSRPGENGQEAVRMAAHGLSNAGAILAATAWAADLLRAPAGRLLAGLRADIVVLPADPLADVRALARPEEFELVMARGAILRRQ